MITESDQETEKKDDNIEVEPSPALAIVQAALDGNAVKVSDAFKGLVQNKAMELVQQRKQDIANSLVTPDQVEPEQNPEDDEDFVSDEPETEQKPQDNEDKQ